VIARRRTTAAWSSCAAMMALLGTGTLRIDHGREQKSVTISGGFLQGGRQPGDRPQRERRRGVIRW